MDPERHPSLDERFDPAVRIVDYDPAWPEIAAAESARIVAAMGEAAVRIDHVGSTAVPGLAAKPIVDLAARPRTHHLHVCAAGSADERRHLAVRDYLRAHPDEVAAYAELKRRLVARVPGDRLAYIEGKDSYVAALERRALAWNQT